MTQEPNDHDRYFAANRELWDLRLPLHLKSKFYDVDAFRRGQSSLCGIETKEMGSVDGKSMLHLQCHFGLDTLSLARLGASVTGVDFSAASITAARNLADELGLSATFLCCNVLELRDHLSGQFDIVFTSFGVLGWLPDLTAWAQLIGDYLVPGGFLYLLEFHPQFMQLNDRGEIQYEYFHSRQPDDEMTTATYADGTVHTARPEYWWNHTISQTVSAVLRAGLQITLFHEFPYSAYKISPSMIETEPGRWVNERLKNKIPYMFSLRADKTTDPVAAYDPEQVA